MIYSKLLINLQVTVNQSESYYTFTLLTVCFSTNQKAIILFSLLTVIQTCNQKAITLFSLLTVLQSEGYYTFFTVDSLFSTNQWAISYTLFTVDSLFFKQSEGYYTFFFSHVQEKHVATLFGIYLRLLLMELNYVIYSYILAFGAEILIISYFSPLDPPLHSQCLLASLQLP